MSLLGLIRRLPWQFLSRIASRSFGIIDPVSILAKLRSFSQPSEVQEPMELLRAGVAFHARGMINARAIQNNLDWIWPYWVERQFDPADPAFIPRAFSFSHVNLTHRNWTALGHPGLDHYCLVDPRGLTTPLHDGWSIDMWLVLPDGGGIFPSKSSQVRQSWGTEDEHSLHTHNWLPGLELHATASLLFDGKGPRLSLKASAVSDKAGWLVAALRPYNPEGVQFIERIDWLEKTSAWRVNSETDVVMSEKPDRIIFSNYRQGDVAHRLDRSSDAQGIECEVGLATGAALFQIPPGKSAKRIEITVPLEQPASTRHRATETDGWDELLRQSARLEIPDSRMCFLHKNALKTLLLLSAGDCVPGPYTYRRFWFRDACFMVHALMSAGHTDRARRIIDSFLGRQTRSGYLHSQEGEWDSNGQVLWIMERFRRVSGEPLKEAWRKSIHKGAEWIIDKRQPMGTGSPGQGLFPPGFSAEHLGPNDHYYWDNFWGVAGLRAAAAVAEHEGREKLQERYLRHASMFFQSLLDSIKQIPASRSLGGIPAAPGRRMDSGAVGSLVADYPLQLVPSGDFRIENTLEFLLRNCMLRGAFFHEIIHSGINAYLTMHIAQALLRRNDSRFRELMEATADLASPTGQWPEAIHPQTGGGCMGDGQHGWAAAEWAMLIHNAFVREEEETLVLGSGIFPEWLKKGEPLRYGPAGTRHGSLFLSLEPENDFVRLQVEGMWHDAAPDLLLQVPGCEKMMVTDGGAQFELRRMP